MKNLKNKSNCVIVILIFSIFLIEACNKNETTPTVETKPISGFSTGNGTVTSDGNLEITERGICWSETGTPTINDNKSTAGKGIGDFTCNLSNLKTNTNYYIRAYATNKKGTSYGKTLTYSICNGILYDPIRIVESTKNITTNPIEIINADSVNCSIIIENYLDSEILNYGICWNTSSSPTVTDNKTEFTINKNLLENTFYNYIEFDTNISGLQPNMTYYGRTYITTPDGIIYGNEIIFEIFIPI